jgi:hypothetical protein
MKTYLKSKFLVTLLIAGVSVWAARSGYASADPFLDGQIKLVESQVKHWETMSYFLGALTLMVFICGVVVGLLQPGATKGKKITAGVLAFASAVIVAFTHTFFQADDRAYDKVAQQARMKLKDFAYNLELFSTLDDDTKAGLHKQFGDLKREIDQLEYNTLHNAAPISSRPAPQSSILISEAWAGQETDLTRAPTWAKNPPADEYNLYYLGIAEGKTFQEAGDSALVNARDAVASAVAKEAAASTLMATKPQLIEELGKVLGSSAEIAETFVAPNPTGGFRGYVLLRLSREAAAFRARSIFVKAGIRYDEKFLDTIKKESRQ